MKRCRVRSLSFAASLLTSSPPTFLRIGNPSHAPPACAAPHCARTPVYAAAPRLQVHVGALAAAAALALAAGVPALAVSGGGLDYASKDFSGVDFHGDYSGKDFTTGLFRGCSFRGAVLRGARMFKAELTGADMRSADMTGASVEGAVLRGTDLSDAVLTGAYMSDTILQAASIAGADFTDALISPENTIARLCRRPDAVGVNPKTGADTRESLMCPP